MWTICTIYIYLAFVIYSWTKLSFDKYHINLIILVIILLIYK